MLHNGAISWLNSDFSKASDSYNFAGLFGQVFKTDIFPFF